MVVVTPFARVGENGRVLHTYRCPRVDSTDATYLTRDEAARFLAMWGSRPCGLCEPDIARRSTAR